MLFSYNLFKMIAFIFLFIILILGLNTNFAHGQPVQGKAETDNIKSEDQNSPVSKSRLPGEISDIKCREYAQYVDENYLLTNKKCVWDLQDLIVDGSYAISKEFPHMVQLGYDTREGIQWFCSGSLISEQYVLTAAHCLSDRVSGGAKYARMGIVKEGEDDHKQQFNITQIIRHPEYKQPSLYHDIGLVKLHQPATLNSWVRPACIYTSNASTLAKGIYSVWSKEDSSEGKNSLLRYHLNLYDQAECNKAFEHTGATKLEQGIKNENMICAGYSNKTKLTCQSNSGGPLQVYRTGSKELSCMYDIVGITSFGIYCAAPVDATDVFTRVSYYVKWIENIVWP